MNNSELQQFLGQLWHNGVELWLDDGQLRFKGQPAIMTEERLTLLRDNKAAIVSLLTATPDAYQGYPLSLGQQSIYLQQTLAPASCAYHLSTLLQLKPGVVIDRLSQSLDQVLSHHSALRQRIRSRGGVQKQQTHVELPPVFTQITLDSTETIEDWAKQAADVPFNLETDALIRVTLVTTTNGDQKSNHLLVVVHHIIADFWALSLILNELQQRYAANSSHTECRLPVPGKSCKDYVLNEAAWLNSKDCLTAKAHWHEQLTPLPTPIQLKTDYQRPAQRSYQGNETGMLLSKALTQQINQQATQAGTSAFIWVMSCYQIFLHHYSLENRFAIGTPLLGRMDSEYQKIAGHFTQPVCFLADFNVHNTFIDLLTANKQQLQQALVHQQYPLQRLIEELVTDSEHQQHPLFQHAFSWNQLKSQPQNGALFHGVVNCQQLGAIYDLVLTGFDQGHQISLQWRYDTDLFAPATISRFGQHLIAILEQSVKQPGLRLQTMNRLTASDSQQIAALNTTTQAPAYDHLMQRFYAIVDQYGEIPALTDGQQITSYDELHARSNQVAHWLKQQDISQQDRIGLIMPRGLDLLTAILGCLKINAVFVPIDPNYPRSRITTMLTISACKQVLCEQPAQHIEGFPCAVLSKTFGTQAVEDAIDWQTGHAEDSACILFTSGSTGEPKGVDIPQRALIRLGINNGFLDIQASDRVGYAAQVAFDASNLEIWPALLNGGTLVLIDDDSLLNPPVFSSFLSAQPLDALFVTAALFKLMLEYQPTIFNGIETLMTGGEAMDVKSAQTFCRNNDKGRLLNLYGPTENGTVSSFHRITADCLQASDIPIGRPVNQSQIHILTPHQQPCPVGVVGEIVVGGSGVAKGYLNHDHNHNAFINDHCRCEGLLYRTGDAGYLNHQGQIIYQGRADDQLKIRGFRVELADVEYQMSRYPGIGQIAIISATNARSEKQLLAYFTHTEIISREAMRQFLQARLPAYMVPSAFMQIERLPLTANGKIDKKALPTIAESTTADLVAPRHPLEVNLHKLWLELLERDTLSIDDNFFQVGGHSLLAAKCLAAMHESLGIDISLRDLFDYPTLRTLTDQITMQQQEKNPGRALPPLSAHNSKAPVPAGLAQHRLWFLQQLDPEAFTYNMPISLRFQQALNHKDTEQALLQLIRQHAALRSKLIDKAGKLFLQDNPDPDWSLDFLDLSTDSTAEKNTAYQQQLLLLSQHVFDLNTAPLLKARLIKYDEADYRLALVMHHINIDGTSVNRLLTDLSQRLIQHNPLPPREDKLDYLDYCHFQQQQLDSPEMAEQLAFWVTYLASAPRQLNLPTDHPRPAKPSHRGETLKIQLDATLTAQLTDLAHRNNASLFHVLMSAYAILLSRYCQQSDICIGFPVSGRQHEATQDMVGLFVNNLVYSTQIDPEQSVDAFIKTQRDNLLNLLDYQDVPFDTLIEHCKVDRTVSHTPFLQASMQFENGTLEDRLTAAMGTAVTLDAMPFAVAKYDLNLCCCKTREGIDIGIEYARDLFEPERIDRLAQHMTQILTSMVANADRRIADVAMLTAAEKKHLVAQVPIKPAEQTDPLVIDAFEHICTRFADNIAINDDQSSLSYRLLNQASNRLAHYLLAKGLGTGDFIGVSMHHSADLIITLLAILKTGAAYIPLDPQSPAERTAFIINDAGIQQVIADHPDAPACKEPIVLTDILRQLARQPTTNPDCLITAETLAYVIYTSGTTGQPKGCLISHGNLARLFTVTQPIFDFNAADVWCLFHSYAFDFAVWEIFSPLVTGARLAIVDHMTARTPDAFYRFLHQQQVTVLNQTPSAFTQLIGIDQRQPLDLSLRQVIFGGEALQLASLHSWVNRHPLSRIRLTNMYGITETTVHVTYHHIQTSDLSQGQNRIGKPLADMAIQIVDHHGQLAPIGITGEICVSGAGVSQGYLNREDLTRSRFIRQPLYADGDTGTPTHSIRYRSGDLGRWLPDGTIEYLGREDDQVKIRGYRIELAEIEAALNQAGPIDESRVIVSQDEQGKALMAYCRVTSTDDLDKADIRTQLKQRLPAYMIPQAILYLEQWPLTSNGKIATERLPKASIEDFITAPYRPAGNDTEATLVRIWQDILDLERIGIHDNFFDLGGHSLLATQVNAQIKTQLNCELELRAIFDYPTIAGLALHILASEIERHDMDDDELLAMLDALDDEL